MTSKVHIYGSWRTHYLYFVHALHSGLAVFLAIVILGGGTVSPYSGSAAIEGHTAAYERPAPPASATRAASPARERAKARLQRARLRAAAGTHTAAPKETFPPFLGAAFPVTRIPNWGAMRTPAEWNRPYSELTSADFVAVPAYDLTALVTPMQSLTQPTILTKNISVITAKIFYSTRFMGKYDLDADEFTAGHAGVDLKLALGTPLGAIGGGSVQTVTKNERLGLHVIIEHRIEGEGTFYSIYGHLGSADVQAGDTVTPGQRIGTVGLTGQTTAPHVHLELDVGHGEEVHTPYFPDVRPSNEEVVRWTINPITFIRDHTVVRTAQTH